ncbi:3-oxoacyl-ACP synthase III family protein [Streptomyces sp. NPDC001037]|uniref:3-oxoacyl-ACP synthase III family protein n=1 Tax=Streptomyces sp. NPDC001037 TaxID=3364542 RepID=UPI003692F8A2
MDPAETRLLSVGTALPGPPIDNVTLGKHFRMDTLWQQWIETFIGTRTRHLAVDLGTGEQRDTLASLGTAAARQAMAAAGSAAEDVDLLVLGTATPDALMPATVNVIADALGIDDVVTYQLQSGCSGAVQALDLARRLLSTGRHRTALVIGGDVIAKHYVLDADLRRIPPAELVNFVLFGDGAGAAVLSAGPDAGDTALRTTRFRLVGKGRAPGQILEWFGPAHPPGPDIAAHEDYKAIEGSVPLLAAEILDDVLGELDWKRDDLDYLLPPQLSVRMTEKITGHLAVTGAQHINCVGETGNNGNALVFFQLHALLDRLVPGDRVVGIAIESSKWIKSGFALEQL